MRREKSVCLLLFVVALSVADTSLAQKVQSLSQLQQSAQIGREATAYTVDRYVQRPTNETDLPKVRAHLTEVWQQLGMSAEDARMVASAYTIRATNVGQARLLAQKSDEGISSLIQSALVDKKYAWADQLMISYERRRLLASGNSLTQSGR